MNQHTGTDVDVIVAGGGPVGVMTGLLLARRGFTVRVVDFDSLGYYRRPAKQAAGAVRVDLV